MQKCMRISLENPAITIVSRPLIFYVSNKALHVVEHVSEAGTFLKTAAWKQKQSVYFCTTNGFLSLQPEWKVSPLPLCMFVSENSRVDLERRMRTGGWWLQGVKMDISVPTIFSCSLSDLLSFPSCHHYWRAGTSSPLLTSLPLPSVWMGVTSAQLWQGGSARLLLESKSWISHLVRSAFKLLHFSEDVAAGWFLTPS